MHHIHNHAARRVRAVRKDVHLHKIYILVDLLYDDVAIVIVVDCFSHAFVKRRRELSSVISSAQGLFVVRFAMCLNAAAAVSLGSFFPHANERANVARGYNDHRIKRTETRCRTAKVWGSVPSFCALTLRTTVRHSTNDDLLCDVVCSRTKYIFICRVRFSNI